ncbi:UNVERIFIED_CONTAM: hypothetical protein FKN15_015876 [Acipenser sinensis]
MGIREFCPSPTSKLTERSAMQLLSDHSPRRLSDISSQLRQLRYLTVEDPIKEELKSARSFLDVNSALGDLSTIEVRILRITGYYRHSAQWSPSSYDPQQERPAQSVSVTTGVESESSETVVKPHCRWCPLGVLRKLAWGLVLACCVAVSWAGSTHIAKLALHTINAPFFLTWFTTTWNLLFFPLYYVGHLFWAEKRQSPLKQSVSPIWAGLSMSPVVALFQCVAGAMYITGFAESIAEVLNLSNIWAVRGISMGVLLGLLGINLAGVRWIIRLQLLLLAVLAVSALDFVVGTFSHLDPVMQIDQLVVLLLSDKDASIQ